MICPDSLNMKQETRALESKSSLMLEHTLPPVLYIMEDWLLGGVCETSSSCSLVASEMYFWTTQKTSQTRQPRSDGRATPCDAYG